MIPFFGATMVFSDRVSNCPSDFSKSNRHGIIEYSIYIMVNRCHYFPIGLPMHSNWIWINICYDQIYWYIFSKDDGAMSDFNPSKDCFFLVGFSWIHRISGFVEDAIRKRTSFHFLLFFPVPFLFFDLFNIKHPKNIYSRLVG